ncbi:metal ABC transporter solute-binding protein, Zn/Mn family [Chlamydia sp. 17-3921]|uniref:metal ABC transporter solute-binding protein, Zn/Mn family n=1 Tax=Chlamydia sp. 17-3921 TaxID=2675798 RepID=UPI0019192D0B|nr:zinc ABC transporter substrate-binding protein [Chlamydia sp. 17-3921]
MRTILFLFYILFYSLATFGEEPSPKPRIIVSIAPYKFLVEQIAGNTCQIYSIVTNHFDPHTYEPSPRQVEEIQQGQIWFRIGEAFEAMCGKSLNCEQIDLTENLSLLSKCCNKSTSFDTHTWLSPKNLKLQVQTITETLAKKYPQYAKEYEARKKELIATLDALDKEIFSITESIKQRHILVSHSAFGYFCRDYGFSQLTIEKDNHIDLSPRDISHLFQNIRKHELSSVILLQHAGRRSSAMLAERFHMQIVSLDPYAENVISNLKTIATTFANL